MAGCIWQVQSKAKDINGILGDLSAGFAGEPICLLILYFSPRDDAAALAAAVTQAFAPTPVIGCSTAGEIGCCGYGRDGLVAIGLGGPDFTASCALISNLSLNGTEQTQAALAGMLEAGRKPPAGWRRFALTLFDGFSLREEQLSSAIHAVLGDIPVCGGSAGDGLRMEQSDILFDGRLHRDCVIVALVTTSRPLHVFKTEHFLPSAERVVITGALAEQRIVTEINGRPAASEYARLIGCPRQDLNTVRFARHPLMVRVGGRNFVRSILQARDDDSLRFACAIDVGLVLRLANPVAMAASLSQQFADIRQRIGPPELVLGFDCILRRLELEDKGELETAGAIMAANHVVGFSTQGEHFQGMHINQTFTGIALGYGAAP